ncbi:MAG: hypothetical protein WBA16_00910 [Nonlabens sp.]
MAVNSKKEFEVLYHSSYDKIWRLCLGYSNYDRELASDLTQEVFVKV